MVIADGIPADVMERLKPNNMQQIIKEGAYKRAYVGGTNLPKVLAKLLILQLACRMNRLKNWQMLSIIAKKTLKKNSLWLLQTTVAMLSMVEGMAATASGNGQHD